MKKTTFRRIVRELNATILMRIFFSPVKQMQTFFWAVLQSADVLLVCHTKCRVTYCWPLMKNSNVLLACHATRDVVLASHTRDKWVKPWHTYRVSNIDSNWHHCPGHRRLEEWRHVLLHNRQGIINRAEYYVTLCQGMSSEVKSSWVRWSRVKLNRVRSSQTKSSRTEPGRASQVMSRNVKSRQVSWGQSSQTRQATPRQISQTNQIKRRLKKGQVKSR